MCLLKLFNLNQFSVLFILDKKELKEWKKMVEKQLTEKVREPFDAEVKLEDSQCFGPKQSGNSALK